MQPVFSYNFSIISRKNKFHRVTFFILSSGAHYINRLSIKRTWIRLCRVLSCGYFFVIATKNYYHLIKKECNNDIIGLDIFDSYYNLTILSSNIYKYCKSFKLQTDYIIRNDDDIRPNIPIIVLYINIYIDKLKISGYYYPQLKVRRNINSTLYIPESIYPFAFFPPFVAGGFVITHINLISSLYFQLKREIKILYREDMNLAVVYKKLNITFQKLNKYYHRKSKIYSIKNKLNDICCHECYTIS